MRTTAVGIEAVDFREDFVTLIANTTFVVRSHRSGVPLFLRWIVLAMADVVAALPSRLVLERAERALVYLGRRSFGDVVFPLDTSNRKRSLRSVVQLGEGRAGMHEVATEEHVVAWAVLNHLPVPADCKR